MDPSYRPRTLEDRAGRSFSQLSLHRARTVLVAISGGSDSLSLLILLKIWRDRHAPDLRIAAATVDHRLRAEAASEAGFVGSVCARLGIQHRIVGWTETKPATGVAAAARLARYRLLADTAIGAGNDMILTGHTLDDQAETVAMREARKAGLGLAGMAPLTRYADRLWIVRPLLGIRRAELRSYLSGAGERWIDDPSNDNLDAERVGIRRRLVEDQVEFTRLISLAQESEIRRSGLSRGAAEAIDRAATMPSPGLIRLVPGFLEDANPAAVHALRILLATVGGVEQLPPADRVTSLVRAMTSAAVKATLSRCVIARRRDGIYLHRENRTLPLPSDIASPKIWDGRFLVSPRASAVRVQPIGLEHARATLPAEGPLPRGLTTSAMAAEPHLVPHSPGATIERRIAPFAVFLPGFDIAARNAVARLVGLAGQPTSIGQSNHPEREATA